MQEEQTKAETVAIVGSRAWSDFDAFCELMPSLAGVARIISGGAPGVDMMARMLAKVLGIPFTEFPPDRSKPFSVAAHERNQRIADQANKMIAFPGPKSRGTWDSVRRMRAKGIEPEIIKAPV